MKLIGVFVAVMAVAVIQLFVAGPLGLSLDLGRHLTAVAVFIGGMIGVIAFVFFGEALVDAIGSGVRRVLRRPPKDTSDDEPDTEEETGWFHRLVDRYGAPALGIAGPLTIGGWAAAVLGTSSGIGKLRLILWLAVGQAIVTVSYVYSIAELTD